MRIVGGSHRGRRLEAPAGRDVRPTTDRTREALFNILAHQDWGADGAPVLEGARVLDAFCGTGALGLEALSRGAAHGTFMDMARGALDMTRRNVATLGETARCTILRADATKPPPAGQPCTLVFLDPPYGRNLPGPALAALAGRGWLAPGAVVVIETGQGDPLAVPDGYETLDERGYGETRIVIVRRG